jgi:hypothetical protein
MGVLHMQEINQVKKEIEAIESILVYIERIRRNRDVIEQYYFANRHDAMQHEIFRLFEGVVWIEFAMIEMKLPFHKEQKDQLFNGISEALEAKDWLTVIDFISYDLMQYLRLLEETLTAKYVLITGGKQ